MRIAYLDCFSGISGDMFLGALLDAGVSLELIQKTVASLNVGATLEVSRVDRAGISATKADVIITGERGRPREEFWAEQHRHRHEHASKANLNREGEGRGQGQGHAHDEAAAKSAVSVADSTHLRRGLHDILSLLTTAPISERAKRTASEIFVALGAAEARVHNIEPQKVHFHEVGAADAIVDIVCAAVGAEALGVEGFVSSPLNVGSGTVACAHGVLPVPAPATAELLKGVPIYSGEIEKELVTPTGAAIAKILVSSFEPRPAMIVDTIGYGAGSRNFAGQPNVLRITIGETDSVQSSSNSSERSADVEEISILEANLDDLSPQLIGYLVDLALREGALDVFTTAVQMKKNRPGTLLTVLCRPEAEHKMHALVFRESSTLGVRSRREQRHFLQRRSEVVTTRWGDVRIKIGTLNGATSHFAPEYEDCRRIADEHHVPLKTVLQEALRLYLDQTNGQR